MVRSHLGSPNFHIPAFELFGFLRFLGEFPPQLIWLAKD